MTATEQSGYGRHQPDPDPALGETFCAYDDEVWPCPAVEALQAEVDRGRVTADQLEALAAAYPPAPPAA